MAGQRRSSLDRRNGKSDFRLFRHFKGIIDLYSQVSDGAFKLRVTKQELDCSQVLHNQSSLWADTRAVSTDRAMALVA
jgi:hypothetical protein